MHFGIFLRHYFPYGGLQRDALRLFKAAQNAGHSPILVVSKWEGHVPADIQVRLVPEQGFSNHAKDSIFARICCDLMRTEDLETGISFSRVEGIPFHFCGDFCFKEKFTRNKPNWMKWLPRYRYFLNREKRIFDSPSRSHIFFLAQSEMETFQKHYHISQERYSVLPPWLKRNEAYQQTEKENRKRLLDPIHLSEETPYLLFVGSDFHRKGLDLAIDALACLQRPEMHLIVCGRDNSAPFNKLAIERRISHRVHFLGPRDDVADWMRSASCLIHPARAEPAGMVLLEALTHFLPVVCSGKCGYAEHVRNAGCDPIPHGANGMDIARIIDSHLCNRHHLRQTIENWLAAEDRYQTAEIMIEKMQITAKANHP